VQDPDVLVARKARRRSAPGLMDPDVFAAQFARPSAPGLMDPDVFAAGLGGNLVKNNKAGSGSGKQQLGQTAVKKSTLAQRRAAARRRSRRVGRPLLGLTGSKTKLGGE